MIAHFISETGAFALVCVKKKINRLYGLKEKQQNSSE